MNVKHFDSDVMLLLKEIVVSAPQLQALLSWGKHKVRYSFFLTENMETTSTGKKLLFTTIRASHWFMMVWRLRFKCSRLMQCYPVLSFEYDQLKWEFGSSAYCGRISWMISCISSSKLLSCVLFKKKHKGKIVWINLKKNTRQIRCIGFM